VPVADWRGTPEAWRPKFHPRNLYWLGFFIRLARVVALESSELFRHVPATQWERLRGAVLELSFAAGEQIFREVDPGDGIYVVEKGRIELAAAPAPL